MVRDPDGQSVLNFGGGSEMDGGILRKAIGSKGLELEYRTVEGSGTGTVESILEITTNPDSEISQEFRCVL